MGAVDGLLATAGSPSKVAFDPTDNAQPSYSPQSDRIAFTVFTCEAIFWLIEP